jgi:hypothetical protein
MASSKRAYNIAMAIKKTASYLTNQIAIIMTSIVIQ